MNDRHRKRKVPRARGREILVSSISRKKRQTPSKLADYRQAQVPTVRRQAAEDLIRGESYEPQDVRGQGKLARKGKSGSAVGTSKDPRIQHRSGKRRSRHVRAWCGGYRDYRRKFRPQGLSKPQGATIDRAGPPRWRGRIGNCRNSRSDRGHMRKEVIKREGGDGEGGRKDSRRSCRKRTLGQRGILPQAG